VPGRRRGKGKAEIEEEGPTAQITESRGHLYVKGNRKRAKPVPGRGRVRAPKMKAKVEEEGSKTVPLREGEKRRGRLLKVKTMIEEEGLTAQSTKSRGNLDVKGKGKTQSQCQAEGEGDRQG
jgi:hypothetical protein